MSLERILAYWSAQVFASKLPSCPPLNLLPSCLTSSLIRPWMITYVRWLSIAMPISERSEFVDEDDILESTATEVNTQIAIPPGNDIRSILEEQSIIELSDQVDDPRISLLRVNFNPEDPLQHNAMLSITEASNLSSHLSPSGLASWRELDIDYYTNLVESTNRRFTEGSISFSEYQDDIDELRTEFNLTHHQSRNFDWYFDSWFHQEP